MVGQDISKLSEFQADHTMLIVVDMNNGFAKEGALYSPRVEKLIEPIVDLVQAAISRNMMVLAYTDQHIVDAKEFNAYPTHCVRGSNESELVAPLKALISVGLKVKYKNSTNGLLVYNPAQEIVGISSYIIVGCVTDICIYQYATTLRAYLNEHNLDGEVIVSEAHVDTYDIPDVHDGDLYHTMALKSMVLNGIKVVKDIMID